MKKKELTIYDISQKTGVSIATVSRVINGATNVSEKTRERILSEIEASGYRPNAFARGFALNTMKTIGILCADSSDAYLAKAVYYIEEELRFKQYDSLLLCTGYDFDAKRKATQLLLAKKVDALILIGSNFVSERAEDNSYIAAAAASVPVMLLNASFDCDNVYSLYCDDYAAVRSVTSAFIEEGRKNLLYLYNSKSYSGRKKLLGFRAAFAEVSSEIKHEECYVNGGPEDISDFLLTIEKLFSKGEPYDAVVASEDYLAIAVLKYAIRNNLKVPSDLSIVGYNNSSLSRLCEPELTSIENRLEPISKQLVRTLLSVLNNENMPKKTEYSAELIRRCTTKI